jgi:hypothetical protein
MTGLLVRLAVAIPVAVVAVVVRLLGLGLRLLALAGFRGARLVALATTLVGVWWAATRVGLRPAVWLAVIGWAAWAGRHHRAAIAQHAAVRRLTAALEQHTGALAAATETLQIRPSPGSASNRPSPPTTTAPGERDRQADSLSLTAEQSPEESVAALRRYAAAFVARHTRPTDDATPTRLPWRRPR